MPTERLLGDLLKEFQDAKKTGAVYISVVETSEDLIRMYFEDGKIYHIRYGSAIGKDCIDILDYYNLWSATYFDGIKAPPPLSTDLPSTDAIVAIARKSGRTVKVK